MMMSLGPAGSYSRGPRLVFKLLCLFFIVLFVFLFLISIIDVKLSISLYCCIVVLSYLLALNLMDLMTTKPNY